MKFQASSKGPSIHIPELRQNAQIRHTSNGNEFLQPIVFRIYVKFQG